MGYIIPERFISLLLEKAKSGQSIKGKDILPKIRESLEAWRKLLEELSH